MAQARWILGVILAVSGPVLAQSGKEIERAGNLAIQITVQIQTSDFNGRRWNLKSGTGTIVDDSGIVVTCSHVLGKHFQTRVRLSTGDILAATVLGRFPEHDLAVLKFKAPEGLKVVPRYHPGLLPPNTPMICLGFPRGERSMCLATLKGYLPNNETNLISPGTPVVLFKGKIVPGYSGGPLMTLDGGLAGVVFAVDPARDQAVAIPISVLQKDLERIDWAAEEKPTEAPAKEALPKAP